MKKIDKFDKHCMYHVVVEEKEYVPDCSVRITKHEVVPYLQPGTDSLYLRNGLID